ncbi:exodeoxyribonuclease VII large subunit [Pseudorhodoferax sp.]|uniref:exodeoxyribonuclease VII large subunit n=1 Tax=Pseudorhodoferax sp. TaxID=1993553 RepID=UPI002DD63242|nr:exodeoxyribonuclease VII large subunit [Pseudorhodoferax sp.]
MHAPLIPGLAPLVWQVGALCRAVAGALDQQFNPVAVRGEISGFSRASSGHCYFQIKDGQGQIRCAMFRRAAALVDFSPRDGDLVELRGRLSVYEARGDLQLVVESLQRAGAGALMEQFLRLKARLEAEGLFDAARKRPLPALPRGIGLVTSPGAAALHDVVTALRRRLPHVPVLLAPALVQGSDAPADLVRALGRLYAHARADTATPIDLILLVRGGGSVEDLWAFNDEALARQIAQSPVPLVSGVGHETDFTIADFVADLRAPTPTAAAELAAQPREVWLAVLDGMATRLHDAAGRSLDARAQRLDQAAARLGRPSQGAGRQRLHLAQLAQRMQHGLATQLAQRRHRLDLQQPRLDAALRARAQRARATLDHVGRGLELLDPRVVLQRGYAWLADEAGNTVTRVAQLHDGAAVRATLVDGEADLQVRGTRRV